MPPSDKKSLFIEHYLKTLNGTQAAKSAGYSPQSARQQASVLLTNPAIKQEIEGRLKEEKERLKITKDRVLDEVAAMAFHSLSDEDSNVRPTDKLKALDMLMKRLGLYEASTRDEAGKLFIVEKLDGSRVYMGRENPDGTLPI